MEIKLNTGDKITIPEDCEATIEGNQIIIKKQEEFKDGDILISKYRRRIVIFSNYSKNSQYLFDSYFNSTDDLDFDWFTKNFRHTTEEEKQKFFDSLKAKGLKWNAETKQMEKIRKRVASGESYLYIDVYGNIHKTLEFHKVSDNLLYNLGNYYLLEEKEQAEKDAEKIKAIFKEKTKLR